MPFGLIGGLISGIAGLFGASRQAKREKEAEQRAQDELRQSELNSQSAQRDALRRGAGGRGAGDFSSPRSGTGNANQANNSLRQNLKRITGA